MKSFLQKTDSLEDLALKVLTNWITTKVAKAIVTDFK